MVGAALIDTELDQSQLKALVTQVAASKPGDLAIFVSTTTAQIVGQNVTTWPAHLTNIAVGPSTQTVLNQYHISATYPEQSDTEGLLAMPELAQSSGSNVYLVKGHGGREKLAKGLMELGAKVIELPIYTRRKMATPFYTRQWQPSEIKGIIATSGEQVEAAFEQYSSQWLASLKWTVVSERVGSIARGLGVTRINICNGASDKALIDFMQQIAEQ